MRRAFLPTLADITSRVEGGGALSIEGLSGSAGAWLTLAALGKISGPLLWVAPSPEAAQASFNDLRFYFSDPGTGTSLVETPGTGRRVLLYPDWDVTPYSGVSPHSEVTRRRMEVLHTLKGGQPVVVVASASSLLKKVIPREALDRATDWVVKGENLDRETFLRRLVEGGYLSTDRTEDRGCFSVRGHILDVFAPLYGAPLRFESWGDTVDAIRRYDPYTQRSVGADLSEAQVLPMREEVLTPAAIRRGKEESSRLCLERHVLPRHRIALQEQLERGYYFAGIECYLPLFHPQLETVFDYLGPRGALVVEQSENVREAARDHRTRLQGAWSEELAEEALVPDPGGLFLEVAEFSQELSKRGRILLPHLITEEGVSTLRMITEDLGALRGEILGQRGEEEGGMLIPLVKRLTGWHRGGVRAVLGSRSRAQAQQTGEMLAGYPLRLLVQEKKPEKLDLASAGEWETTPHHAVVLPTTPQRGFLWKDAGMAVVAEQEVLGRRGGSRGAPPASTRAVFTSFSDLKEGNWVVHARHGIGVFRGLTRLSVGTSENDYLLLEYQDGDRLYVPVHKLDQLTRWVGPKGSEPLVDKLGGATWKTRRKKAEEAVQKLAQELLDLHAARAVARKEPLAPPGTMYTQFAATFPYEETEDQLEAIATVQKDLGGDKPMDRLLCGDVGFGKTEVAMRAAFQAVEGGRQVAVLVPTTILAFQHYQTFRERLEGFPVKVAMLSRFLSDKEDRAVVADLASGKVDVVVGTHRLLSQDVKFRNLGLLVIDEEHRFGVKHKEKMKELRKNVDVLTLTATPIPRTLHMAMAGMRDLSLIVTPPEGRQGVRTYVARFSASRIKEAIENELRRGGQVFFVHNRVKSIAAMGKFLERTVPGVSVRIAHGQMAGPQLEEIMVGFVQRRFNVLLSTTIIESGIDIPNCNTLLVNRADAFGLAQLYQIRGRVGRGKVRGQAFLLVPPGRALRPEAMQRLKVLQDHADLGAGFKVAAHDLEMRGAGDLLGRNQSGHIAAVGFETYMDLLDQAVRNLRGEGRAEADFDTDIDIACEAYIPSDYVPDQRDRLLYYKRLSGALSEREAVQVTEELEDLYGRVPQPVERLVELIRVKVMARKLRVVRMKGIPSGVEARFDATTPVAPERLAKLVLGNAARLGLSPAGILTVKMSKDEKKDPLPLLKRVLLRLLPGGGGESRALR